MGDCKLYAIQDPDGDINHCNLGTVEDEVIAQEVHSVGLEASFIITLRCGDGIAFGNYPKSVDDLSPEQVKRGWEHLRNRGYKIVSVGLVKLEDFDNEDTDRLCVGTFKGLQQHMSTIKLTEEYRGEKPKGEEYSLTTSSHGAGVFTTVKTVLNSKKKEA